MKVTHKRAKRSSPLEIASNLRRLAQQTADLVQDDYEGVTDNWNTPVTFSVEDQSNGSDLVFNVYARGPNADIFMYVDQGTEKRYAVMRSDFVPRTSPGSLRSGGGGNRRPAYFDYDEANAQARGIVAREFGHTIIENRLASFVAGVRSVLQG